MSWQESCRSRLPALLDANGDLAPPWARFPGYERSTIGWRMGTGEDWLGLWYTFLEHLPRDLATRMAYLRRHPVAPISWADCVHAVLYAVTEDGDEDDDEGRGRNQRQALLDSGLIASDVAYANWLALQTEVVWPWSSSSSPQSAARNQTRGLWFWSRRLSDLRVRGELTLTAVPTGWRHLEHVILAGHADSFELQHGLGTLAKMLCAGQVVAPWQLGLTLDDFEDSFEEGMGYVDAFGLWLMSALDDHEHFERYFQAVGVPSVWRNWVDGRLWEG